MPAEVAAHALRSYRRATGWWSVGLIAFMTMNIATYPSVRDQEELDRLIEEWPDALLALFGIDPDLSLTSPTGYLVSQAFGFVVPMLFVVLGVTFGSRAVAAEEEQGTLDLVLAHAISRRSLFAQKAAVLAVVVGTVGVVTWGSVAILGPWADLHVGLVPLAEATLASVLLGLQSGALALAIGAAVGRRPPAVAGAAAFALTGFVLVSLSEVATGLRRVEWLSPFYWANANVPLVNGLRLVDVAVLVGLAFAACVLGVAAFERRDIGSRFRWRRH